MFFSVALVSLCRVLTAPMKLKACPKCNGTGKVLDDAEVGLSMKRKRIKAKVSLRDQADRMGYSAMFVCDLEKGRRKWHKDLMQAYRNALDSLT